MKVVVNNIEWSNDPPFGVVFYRGYTVDIATNEKPNDLALFSGYSFEVPEKFFDYGFEEATSKIFAWAVQEVQSSTGQTIKRASYSLRL